MTKTSPYSPTETQHTRPKDPRTDDFYETLRKITLYDTQQIVKRFHEILLFPHELCIEASPEYDDEGGTYTNYFVTLMLKGNFPSHIDDTWRPYDLPRMEDFEDCVRGVPTQDQLIELKDECHALLEELEQQGPDIDRYIRPFTNSEILFRYNEETCSMEMSS